MSNLERSMSNLERSMSNIYQKVLSHHDCQRMLGFLEKTSGFSGVLLPLFYFIKPRALSLLCLFLVFWILFQLTIQRAIIMSEINLCICCTEMHGHGLLYSLV